MQNGNGKGKDVDEYWAAIVNEVRSDEANSGDDGEAEKRNNGQTEMEDKKKKKELHIHSPIGKKGQ